MDRPSGVHPGHIEESFGPSFADGGLHFETSNSYDGLVDGSFFPEDWSPLSPHVSRDDDIAIGSDRAARGESAAADSLAPDVSVAQPTIQQDVHDSMFARTLLTNYDVTGITLPWETGIFRELLGDEPIQLVPKMPISNLCQLGRPK